MNSNLEGSLVEITDTFPTALNLTNIKEGSVFKIIGDPATVTFDDVDKPMVQLIHESNIPLEDTNGIVPIVVIKEELIQNSEIIE